MIGSMNQQTTTIAFLLDQCARWPSLRPQDLLKALHQSVFGPGHFVMDQAAGLTLLQKELEALQKVDGPETEPLDGDFCRVHLRYLKESGLAPKTLFRLFFLSARNRCGNVMELEKKLAVLLELDRQGRLPFIPGEMPQAIENWQRQGFPACHHSPEFRAAYNPAYRLIQREFVCWLPVLAAIDNILAEKKRAIVAIEGGSASGKTTLSSLLAEVYDCTVFHMDDFFLRPHQRTQARLAEPGGNVDRERFYQEVLLPLKRGQAVNYCRFDCQTQTLLPAVEVVPKALSIVEGTYSMHPLLAKHYDLSIFLRVKPDIQRARIQVRNGQNLAECFFTTWIPMEHRYFQEMDTENRCDLILEVDA